MINFWEGLVTEISYSMRPLPEAMGYAVKSIHGPLQEVVQSFVKLLGKGEGFPASQIWRKSVITAEEDLLYSKEEMEIVLQWGAGLGNSDRQDQIRLLQLAIERLKAREVFLQSKVESQNKILRYLGFLAGVALVLLFY